MIHNGAFVNCNYDYETVRDTNVGSTAQLLQLAALPEAVRSFVYVSCSQQLNPDEDDDAANAKHVECACGYEQSKLVAELIVKRCAREPRSREQRIRIFKPGYIIGTAESGLANSNDFLWRLCSQLP